MTDADVDGSHIRTLILTFLYRQMPELIARGHIYIAVPPLYKVKLGQQEFYFEKDAQLEDLLARERIPQVVVTDRTGAEVKFTEARWARFSKEIAAVRGLLGPAPRRLRHSGGRADDPAPPRRARDRAAGGHRPRDRRDRRRTATSSHRSSPASRRSGSGSCRPRPAPRGTSRFPTSCSPRRSTRTCASAYAKLSEIVGLPPFKVTVGKEVEEAETYDALRAKVLDAAKQGIQLSRFKGLGEMNAEQLWETTMDPSKRLLLRVDVEDAAAADHLFSTLMGDQVEPRRAFIEQNARDVKFLDV